jgi:hypothetical protein
MCPEFQPLVWRPHYRFCVPAVFFSAISRDGLLGPSAAVPTRQPFLKRLPHENPRLRILVIRLAAHETLALVKPRSGHHI